MNQRDRYCTIVDADKIRQQLSSPDESERLKALHALCPCQNDPILFEAFYHDLEKLTKDENDKIRLTALHVFEDALLHQNDGFLQAKGKQEQEVFEYARPQHGRKKNKPQKQWRESVNSRVNLDN